MSANCCLRNCARCTFPGRCFAFRCGPCVLVHRFDWMYRAKTSLQQIIGESIHKFLPTATTQTEKEKLLTEIPLPEVARKSKSSLERCTLGLYRLVIGVPLPRVVPSPVPKVVPVVYPYRRVLSHHYMSRSFLLFFCKHKSIIQFTNTEKHSGRWGRQLRLPIQ